MFNDPITKSRIMNAPTARMATDIAGSNKRLIIAITDADKKNTMYRALKEKFAQNQGIRRSLEETGTKGLVYHTLNDDYWGDGGDGSGYNHLGELLMRVRREL